MAQGRKSKLTPEMQAKIVSYLQGGTYIETAAAAAGIGKRTLFRWLKNATEKGCDPKYKAFADAVEKAQAAANLRDVTLISHAAKKDWRAAAWRLERRHPKRWGTVQRHEVSGPDGKAVEVKSKPMDLAALSPEELLVFRDLMTKAKGGDSVDSPDASRD